LDANAIAACCPGTTLRSVESIYKEHAEFISLTLERFGVRPGDVEDLAHEVFLIVHRRHANFDGTSLMTTWLFGICRRVAANYRRRRRCQRWSARFEAPRVELARLLGR
jgi:RNA polymerase sigma-70 factor, ECF subfamily